eukprot:3247709-Prymnesium_polylepis.1
MQAPRPSSAVPLARPSIQRWLPPRRGDSVRVAPSWERRLILAHHGGSERSGSSSPMEFHAALCWLPAATGRR